MIGKRLRLLRRTRGLTQFELGNALGISASAVGMYEQGRREPDNETLAEICRLFEVSSDYLLLDNPENSAAPELEEVLADFCRRLQATEGLCHHGVLLSGEIVAQVARAIEVGATVALSQLAEPAK